MGSLGLCLHKTSCSDVCLESHVPGAEGPVPLLPWGRTHPDHSQALRQVTQTSGLRELNVPLSHLVSAGEAGPDAGQNQVNQHLSLGDSKCVSWGLGSPLLALKCSASRQLPDAHLGPFQPPCQMHQCRLCCDLSVPMLPFCDSCLLWAVATCPVISQHLAPAPAVCTLLCAHIRQLKWPSFSRNTSQGPAHVKLSIQNACPKTAVGPPCLKVSWSGRVSQGPGTQGRWCSLSQESGFCPPQALVRLRKSRSVVLGLKAGHEGSHISQHSHYSPVPGIFIWLRRDRALCLRPPRARPCSGHSCHDHGLSTSIVSTSLSPCRAASLDPALFLLLLYLCLPLSSWRHAPVLAFAAPSP